MSVFILICAAVILSCILTYRFSDKLGMPSLLFFMALGMLFGSDGLFKISFSDFHITERICSIALVFIIFYGGFCTKWSTAKPILAKASVLSTLGVILTALLTCGFCYWGLKIPFHESFLIGAVISSTDAASVFSILRSKRLNLKSGTAPLLEIESGSNDPVAYMLMIIGLTMLNGASTDSLLTMFFSQLGFGIIIGPIVAMIGIYILSRTKFVSEGLDTIFVIALVLISFALPDTVNGNGYLSVYLTGIILGNAKIKNKTVLVHFFDGITTLCQIVIFFLLGLLSFPHKIPQIILPATFIALFLTFVARPAAVFAIMLPFKSTFKQCLLVSWAGLRGAASIVFAIMVVANDAAFNYDLFHIVFLISLLSVAFQGSLLPLAAKITDMIDNNSDVCKTFNDYQEESSLNLMKWHVSANDDKCNKKICDIKLPSDFLALVIKREDETIIPNGNTVIKPDDNIILSVPKYQVEADVNLTEIEINKNHQWCKKRIDQINLDKNSLIVVIKRNSESIMPKGKTVIRENDIVVLCSL